MILVEDIRAKSNKLIDYAGLTFIGILSLGYLLYYSNFAKAHIYLSFIKAPLFIGEMVFLICSFLFIFKWAIGPKRLNLLSVVFIFYTMFVFFKALLGYYRWGPLSLRHATLFCYPLFAVFGYSFYRGSFFEPIKAFLVIVLFFIIFKFFPIYNYYILTCLVITLALIGSFSKKSVRYALCSFLVLFFPYKIIFDTSRTFLISNLFAIVYILAGYLVISRIRMTIKIIVCLLLVSFIFYGVSKNCNQNELRSLTRFDGLVERYNNEIIRSRSMEPRFVERKLEARLFNERIAIQKPVQNQVNPPPVAPANNKTVYPKTLSIAKESEAIHPKPAPIPTYDKTSQVIHPAFIIDKVDNTVMATTQNNASQYRYLLVDISKGNDQFEYLSFTIAKNSQIVAVLDNKSSHGGCLLLAVENKTGRVVSLPVTTDKETGQVKISSAAPDNKTIKKVEDDYTKERGADLPCSNILFRFFIWGDALKEIRKELPVLGFDFGKPFRSRTLELLHMGETEWIKDGWISMHNSYIDMIYRAGIFGIVMIVFILTVTSFLVYSSFQKRSSKGILLTGALINWLIAASFREILEMPYSAIPIWCLFGMTFAYLFKDKTT